MRTNAVAASIAMAIAGCSAFVTLDGLRVEDAGTPMPDGSMGDVVMMPDTMPTMDAGTDAEAGPSCPELEGPTMIRTPDGCIDSTEVTRGQYAKFLAAGVDVSQQRVECS